MGPGQEVESAPPGLLSPQRKQSSLGGSRIIGEWLVVIRGLGATIRAPEPRFRPRGSRRSPLLQQSGSLLIHGLPATSRNRRPPHVRKVDVWPETSHESALQQLRRVPSVGPEPALPLETFATFAYVTNRTAMAVRQQMYVWPETSHESALQQLRRLPSAPPETALPLETFAAFAQATNHAAMAVRQKLTFG